MKLTSPFILLLGSIFSLSLEANAVPLNPGQRGIITLPLKRVQPKEGIHPQLMLQQHINRSLQRLARMTGRQEPSIEVLSERLVSLHAHLVGRSSPRIGHAPAALDNQGSKGTVATKASVRQLDTNAGFDPTDLAALESGSVTPANTPTTANSLGLDILANDVGYVATVQMGTPPRDFLILMDSGSSDLWVGAEECQSLTTPGADCGDHTFLGTKSSSSFVDTNQTFNVTYGTGAVVGDIIQDTLVVAGLQLSDHTFGVASQETDEFTGASFDGLMGLAQSSLSRQRTLTPVESLAKAGLIPAAITSYKISRLSDNKNDGEITFGALDTTKFNQATLTNLNNVNNLGFWEAKIDAVTVDGKDLGFNDRTAILDTGTTLLIVPDADAQAIHQQIPGAKSTQNNGIFTIPCTTNASLALVFGGNSFAIQPSDLTFRPVDPNNLTGDCVSGISSGTINGPTVWLVGDVFLKNAYFSTNVDLNTIQLAQLT